MEDPWETLLKVMGTPSPRFGGCLLLTVVHLVWLCSTSRDRQFRGSVIPCGVACFAYSFHIGALRVHAKR